MFLLVFCQPRWNSKQETSKPGPCIGSLNEFSRQSAGLMLLVKILGLTNPLGIEMLLDAESFLSYVCQLIVAYEPHILVEYNDETICS